MGSPFLHHSTVVGGESEVLHVIVMMQSESGSVLILKLLEYTLGGPVGLQF